MLYAAVIFAIFPAALIYLTITKVNNLPDNKLDRNFLILFGTTFLSVIGSAVFLALTVGEITAYVISFSFTIILIGGTTYVARRKQEVFITVSGEELDLSNLKSPARESDIRRNVTEPRGSLELKFIDPFDLFKKEGYPISISGKEAVDRAKQHGADLGLCHAIAFQDKYETEGFGFPVGTCLWFPGTLAVFHDYSQNVTALVWDGEYWGLVWANLDRSLVQGQNTEKLLCPM